MKTLYFKCKLITDIVLNQRAATEGNQNSLDFIPGSNFLGIAAGRLYYDPKHVNDDKRLTKEESLLVFHSGKVRFGDAHPAKDDKRSVRIPASMYKPKLGKMNEKGLYIHHEVKIFDKPKDEDSKEYKQYKDYKDFQPKQCRTGFYLFEGEKMEEIKVEKSFSIKSAYDRTFRRSEDEKMYGYESLDAGSSWIFEVTVEDEISNAIIDKIISSFQGENEKKETRHIGRSRTAQYGLVEIEFLKDEKVEPDEVAPSMNKTENYHYVLIYADSRLIFLDDYGLPTLQPDAKAHFKMDDSEISWKYSQIRTFQYAPWNSTRHIRDIDRCGIEKGSVFYVKVPSTKTIKVQPFVGSYQNEGFGKVIYDPPFFTAIPGENGKAAFTFPEKTDNPKERTEYKNLNIKENDLPLIVYLKEQHNQSVTVNKIYKLVNTFVTEHKERFADDRFASQWGTIRSIAMQYKSKNEIYDQLFKVYLVSGVAKVKWEKQDKRDNLSPVKVFKDFIDQDCEKLTDQEFQLFIINLSAELAKSLKGGNKDGK